MNNQTVKLNKISSTKPVNFRRKIGGYLTGIIVSPIVKTGATPNMISWFGIALTLVCAWLISGGNLLAGGIMVLVAGLFDMLDGAVARQTGQTTKFGAILDSTLDRLSEGIIILSLLAVYIKSDNLLGVLLVCVALIGSYMVSYIRARAEGMGIECEVGILTRPERVVLLALGLALGPINILFLTGAVGIIAALSAISAAQRLLHAWRAAKKN